MEEQRQMLGLATASAVLGILGLALSILGLKFGLIGAIPAAVCGHLAHKRFVISPETYSGHGRAVAGLILGYIQIGWLVAMTAFGAISDSEPDSTNAIQCHSNMEFIYLIKKHAVENGFPRGISLSEKGYKDILKQLDQQAPGCPDGGHYTINSFDVDPVCSVHGSMSDLRDQLVEAGVTNLTDFRTKYPLERPEKKPSEPLLK